MDRMERRGVYKCVKRDELDFYIETMIMSERK